MARCRSWFERLAVSPKFTIPRVVANHKETKRAEERATISMSGSLLELIYVLSAQAAPVVKVPAGDGVGGLCFA
jgi:hypothetical protein